MSLKFHLLFHLLYELDRKITMKHDEVLATLTAANVASLKVALVATDEKVPDAG
jgi:hypothetical protein